MARQAVIVVGASTGGVEALWTLAAGLPPDLPASVFVVLHTTDRPSALAEIIARAGPLPVTAVVDGGPSTPAADYSGKLK
jgi:two-component system chemotaxis response regulator CheB